MIIETIIDTGFVSRNGFEFYRNSHTNSEGTSRPIFYQVLYDGIGFTSDEIQQLTYEFSYEKKINFFCFVFIDITYATVRI